MRTEVSEDRMEVDFECDPSCTTEERGMVCTNPLGLNIYPTTIFRQRLYFKKKDFLIDNFN